MQNLRNKTYQFLRGSENFFKADMVYLAKGNFWQISGQAATSILSLGLTIIFANLLPKETYGLYKYILSLAGVLNIFTLTGMNRAVVQAVAAGNDGAFKTSVRYQLKWNVMQLIAFWILGGYYLINENKYLAIAFLVMSFFSPIIAALNTYGAYLEGKKNFRLNNIFSATSTLIYVVGMIAAIMFSGDIVWLVIAYSLTTFASTIIFYVLTLRLFRPPTDPAGDILKYGRELTFIGAVGPVISQIDKIILSHYWGATQLAVYALASAVPDRATSVIKSWISIGLSKFSEKTPKEINKVFYTRIFQGMVVGLICFIGYFMVAPYLFKYLLPQYMDGIIYSQLLAISFVFAMPNRYITLLFTSQKLSGPIFVSNSIQNVIKVILYTVLGIWGGILGLVLANVLMSFLGTLISATVWRFRHSD
jgi:O-antigen/teichoic acid export membrane protein